MLPKRGWPSIRWILNLFGYRIEYKSKFGTHSHKYDSLDVMAARPIHKNMSVAPPWAIRQIVKNHP